MFGGMESINSTSRTNSPYLINVPPNLEKGQSDMDWVFLIISILFLILAVYQKVQQDLKHYTEDRKRHVDNDKRFFPEK